MNKKRIIILIIFIIIIAICYGISKIASVTLFPVDTDATSGVINYIKGIENAAVRENAITVFLEGNAITQEQANELY